MSILFSGDFHANAAGELSFITKKSLIKRFGLEWYGGIGYHIILGDAGFLWPKNSRTDAYHYRTLGYRPFPVLCVMGNHEPILGRRDIPETDIGIGEKVYVINNEPLVAFLKRGRAYTIEGITFLVLGGGLSIDLEYRIPKISWWEEEYWSEAEKENVFNLLKKKNAFDYVLSHTGPNSINQKVFSNSISHSPKFTDEVAILNDRIDALINTQEWWCGHWHKDRYHYDENRRRGYNYLYSNPVILNKVNDGFIKYYHTEP
jgi:hypothetical protein